MKIVNGIIRLVLAILAMIGATNMGYKYLPENLVDGINVVFCIIIILMAMGSFLIDEDEKEALDREITDIYSMGLSSKPYKFKSTKFKAPEVKTPAKVIEFSTTERNELPKETSKPV